MKLLNVNQLKFLKSVHLISAALWLTCVMLLLILSLVWNRIDEGNQFYMYNAIYCFIDLRILSPAAIVTLITGLIYSLFTKWGFFKHGWLIYKWVVTVALILIGTFYLGPMTSAMRDITAIKHMDALNDANYLHGRSVSAWAAPINSLLLIGAYFVSVYKPWKNINKKDAVPRLGRDGF